jgi:pimeloyl-ACP methyl ester carboxylesterase
MGNAIKKSRQIIVNHTSGKFAFYPPNPPNEIKNKENLEFIRSGRSGSVEIPCLLFKQELSDYVIIYSHGNACDVGQAEDTYKMLSKEMKVSMCLYDYKGYGFSRPKKQPKEQSCCRNLLSVIKYCNTKGYPNDKIILLGHSIGTGPSTYCASVAEDIAGLILMSPFKSIIKTQVDNKLFNYTNKLIDMFSNEYYIKLVTCPVFIIHGMNDKVVPISHGQSLQKKVNNKYDPYWVVDAGHNDIITCLGKKDFSNLIKEFILYVSHKN